jgi:hypothetical protein
MEIDAIGQVSAAGLSALTGVCLCEEDFLSDAAEGVPRFVAGLMCSVPNLSPPPQVAAQVSASTQPHLRRDCAHCRSVCAGTAADKGRHQRLRRGGRRPRVRLDAGNDRRCRSLPQAGSPRPHLRRDWAHPVQLCYSWDCTQGWRDRARPDEHNARTIREAVAGSVRRGIDRVNVLIRRR